MPSLHRFSLVGGTALSLRYGHRSSIDLDLFLHEKFDQPQLVNDLEFFFKERFVYKQQHTYFVDAEESDTPVSFKNHTWESVKKGIRKAVSDYLR